MRVYTDSACVYAGTVEYVYVVSVFVCRESLEICVCM